MGGKGRFNHQSRKKGLTLIHGFFPCISFSFFNSYSALIEKASLRKAPVEELIKFEMFKELALSSNGPVFYGTVFLLLEVDLSSNEYQRMICYLVVNMPWVNIAPKAYRKELLKNGLTDTRTFMCSDMFWASSHWVIFYSANSLIEIDGTVLQQKISRSESGRTRLCSRWTRC